MLWCQGRFDRRDLLLVYDRVAYHCNADNCADDGTIGLAVANAFDSADQGTDRGAINVTNAFAHANQVLQRGSRRFVFLRAIEPGD